MHEAWRIVHVKLMPRITVLQVNTARGKLCDKDVIAKALVDGTLGGYAGDVWFPQPPPEDHVWRDMPFHGMTPHISGTSLSAQARYAAGVREILEHHLEVRTSALARPKYSCQFTGHQHIICVVFSEAVRCLCCVSGGLNDMRSDPSVA
jgi:phosphoglycerate dehydrogenase-like enzyme